MVIPTSFLQNQWSKEEDKRRIRGSAVAIVCEGRKQGVTNIDRVRIYVFSTSSTFLAMENPQVGSLVVYSPWGCKESVTTGDFTFTSPPFWFHPLPSLGALRTTVASNKLISAAIDEHTWALLSIRVRQTS